MPGPDEDKVLSQTQVEADKLKEVAGKLPRLVETEAREYMVDSAEETHEDVEAALEAAKERARHIADLFIELKALGYPETGSGTEEQEEQEERKDVLKRHLKHTTAMMAENITDYDIKTEAFREFKKAFAKAGLTGEDNLKRLVDFFPGKSNIQGKWESLDPDFWDRHMDATKRTQGSLEGFDWDQEIKIGTTKYSFVSPEEMPVYNDDEELLTMLFQSIREELGNDASEEQLKDEFYKALNIINLIRRTCPRADVLEDRYRTEMWGGHKENILGGGTLFGGHCSNNMLDLSMKYMRYVPTSKRKDILADFKGIIKDICKLRNSSSQDLMEEVEVTAQGKEEIEEEKEEEEGEKAKKTKKMSRLAALLKRLNTTMSDGSRNIPTKKVVYTETYTGGTQREVEKSVADIGSSASLTSGTISRQFIEDCKVGVHQLTRPIPRAVEVKQAPPPPPKKTEVTEEQDKKPKETKEPLAHERKEFEGMYNRIFDRIGKSPRKMDFVDLPLENDGHTAARRALLKYLPKDADPQKFIYLATMFDKFVFGESRITDTQKHFLSADRIGVTHEGKIRDGVLTSLVLRCKGKPHAMMSIVNVIMKAYKLVQLDELDLETMPKDPKNKDALATWNRANLSKMRSLLDKPMDKDFQAKMDEQAVIDEYGWLVQKIKKLKAGNGDKGEIKRLEQQRAFLKVRHLKWQIAKAREEGYEKTASDIERKNLPYWTKQLSDPNLDTDSSPRTNKELFDLFTNSLANDLGGEILPWEDKYLKSDVAKTALERDIKKAKEAAREKINADALKEFKNKNGRDPNAKEKKRIIYGNVQQKERACRKEANRLQKEFAQRATENFPFKAPKGLDETGLETKTEDLSEKQAESRDRIKNYRVLEAIV